MSTVFLHVENDKGTSAPDALSFLNPVTVLNFPLHEGILPLSNRRIIYAWKLPLGTQIMIKAESKTHYRCTHTSIHFEHLDTLLYVDRGPTADSAE